MSQVIYEQKKKLSNSVKLTFSATLCRWYEASENELFHLYYFQPLLKAPQQEQEQITAPTKHLKDWYKAQGIGGLNRNEILSSIQTKK